MRIDRRVLSVWLVSGAMVVSAAGAAAQDGRLPLPVFTVQAPDGVPVGSDALSALPQWLLVYVDPATAPNAGLMRMLQQCRSPQLVAKTVVVVAGSAAAGRRWLEQEFGEQPPPFVWFADPEREARTALELPGAPMMAGIRKGKVAWRLIGILSRPESLESIIRTWVEQGGGPEGGPR